MRVGLTSPALLLVLASVSYASEDVGIPVRNELIQTACGTCHERDDEGRMTRISYQRKTPEGWQLTLKRMIRTRGLNLSPDQARQIVRYLADEHGLAPEEARPYFYRAEKRSQLETIPSKEIEDTCVRCHLGARFLTQRRTAEEWKLLKGMHIGYFPVIEFQTFRGPSFVDEGGRGGDGAEDDGRWRADRVLDGLAKDYPLVTPEWKRFQAKGWSRGIAGRWLLTTHEIGKGPATGVVTFEKAGDDYTYEAEVLFADGTRRRQTGEGVLYGGYSWRGSSSGEAFGERREAMMLSQNGAELAGRSFHGAFGELGTDMTLTRLGADPRVAAVWPRAAAVGVGTTEVTVMGANFSDALSADSLGFGQGVTVASVTDVTPTSARLTLEISEDALPGYRDVVLGATQATNAFAVYDTIDYVKVLPEEALARVGGGGPVPKQYAQFEAAAFHRGPDDEPLTDDDVNLGVVQPEWSLSEYHIRHEDDDIEYVGTIDGDGLFTPNVDGPNMDRELNADNFGDVWVVASYRPEGASETLRGRSRLVVTIPVYVFWDLFP